MVKLADGVVFSTALDEYTLTELIGQGGAGRVLGGVDGEEKPIALKLLTAAASDKRRRFKNEINFQLRERHPNIVPILDHGYSQVKGFEGPFYVMPRLSGSLRDAMNNKLTPEEAMKLFGQMLNGVEAAHLKGVVHRDLKPENFVVNGRGGVFVADFGVARFSEDLQATLVETHANQRLANFQYSAPEQRAPGSGVDHRADIFALGLMLNEMFTSSVPHGAGYELISAHAPAYGYLDAVVAAMLRQRPSERPSSIADVKGLIQMHDAAAVDQQKLSHINQTVILRREVDDPLAFEPPKVVGANWRDRQLSLSLDRQLTPGWITAIQNLGNYSSIMGASPREFRFAGNNATVSIDAHAAQNVIDHFKNWLPMATATYRHNLEREATEHEREEQRKLDAERRRLEELTSVNSKLRF